MKSLLKTLTKTMVDGSDALIKSHKIVNDEQSVQHDPRKQEKMGKIHKDFEDTMNSFRHRFAMIVSDMKFLVDEDAPREDIESTSRKLENQGGDPVIEENLANDLDQLSQICSNIPTSQSRGRTENRMSSRDRNQVVRQMSPN